MSPGPGPSPILVTLPSLMTGSSTQSVGLFGTLPTNRSPARMDRRAAARVASVEQR
jgi:hypothetical protein